MRPCNPNSLDLSLNLSLSLNLDLDPPIAAERQLVLADLIALGQVGVVVVLARKDRGRVDGAVQGQPSQERLLDRGPVDHREYAGQRHAHRADVRVGRRGRVIRAARAEHFGTGLELGVDFQPDDGFVSGHGLLSILNLGPTR